MNFNRKILSSVTSLSLIFIPDFLLAQGTNNVVELMVDLDALKSYELRDKFYVSGNPDIIEILEHRALTGSSAAARDLGDIFSYKNEISGARLANFESALKWYQLSLQLGNAQAASKIGDIYKDKYLDNVDLDLSIKYYEEAKNLGDSSVDYKLSDTLLMRKSPGDSEKAISILSGLADSGNSSAQLKLAEIYRDGAIAPIDFPRSISFFESAIGGGNLSAQATFGEGLVRGKFGDPDIDRGIGLLESASDAGNIRASYILAGFFANGPVDIDGPKAIKLYEKALDGEMLVAANRLGELYRDGILVERDLKKAIYYLEMSANANNPEANRILGEGHFYKKFNSLSNTKEGLDRLHRADQLGDRFAVISLANISFSDAKNTKSADKALQMLIAAADDGNPAAAKYVLAIYRNGKWDKIKINLVKAENYLNKYKNLLTEVEFNFEKLLIDGSKSSSINDYEDVFKNLAGISLQSKSKYVTEILSSNPNLYTFIIQKELSIKGFYKGKLNGRMTGETVRSVNKFCKFAEISTECIKGPMHWTTARSIVNKI